MAPVSGNPLFQINSDGTDLHVIRRIEDANWLSPGTSNRVYVTPSLALWSFDNAGGDPRIPHIFGTNEVANGRVPSFAVVDAGTPLRVPGPGISQCAIGPTPPGKLIDAGTDERGRNDSTRRV